MIDRLIAGLGKELELTAEELADIIWLTLIRQSNTPAPAGSGSKPPTGVERKSSLLSSSKSSRSEPPANRPSSGAVAGIAPQRSQSTSMTDLIGDRTPIKVANPPSIRDPLSLARSLRPLMRQIPSDQIEGLDEQATAQQIAEAGIWQPIVKPTLEPWLEVVLVADESNSMLIWRQTVLEFRRLLRNYGTFRDVQLWGLHWENQQLKLRSGIGAAALQHPSLKPEALLNPSGRQLILLITDCVAEYWQQEELVKGLKLWTKLSPVAIVQVFPESMWVRTAIRGFEPVQLNALELGLPNARLTATWSDEWQTELPNPAACLPILPLEPDAILAWSQMVMGHNKAPGYQVGSFALEPAEAQAPNSLTAQRHLEQFQVMSSPMAQRLMGLVAASPVITLPVIRLIQETLLPNSRQMNVAEVLLGGLLEPLEALDLGSHPDAVEYGFRDEEIRQLLLEGTPVPDTMQVFSAFIEQQFKQPLDQFLEEFVAELQLWTQSGDPELIEKAKQLRPFATVTAAVLKRKGGKYRQLAQQIGQQYSPPPPPPIPPLVSFPSLIEVTFETVFVELEAEEQLQPFEFEIATVEVWGRGRKSEVIIQKQRGEAWGYVEQLSETVGLEMVAIPAGTFQMGSPENEPGQFDRGGPQHPVTVPAFFLGKYPVTQAQWRQVAGLPQVERSLDPDPSNFRGDDRRPVERVSWLEATEFCARLSQLTGKPYRLPSEAEWEYACRAGTETPFHFGATITPDLANYNWEQGYGASPKQRSGSKGTTPVGSFGVANAFGLYDLHGNVWEWCEDDWHDSYVGAPRDGNAWIAEKRYEQGRRVIRGGSWFSSPWYCRSAYRNSIDAEWRNYNDGFRVCCSVSGPL
ncbi:hypothetical protein BST81_26300 [Leptolyngbya sp. 'hensonii']|uniref:formylglycine-generating enzyme family protein n=1 Tax=Leptolyngbya sp. 'hensonii' TaxID=1922337 RepID=UPI00094F70B2|nr:formylglycine-generating enzyme family protein [Leptolyngbya sp. 'hensonii']OLP15446.1 hypothetical protein BST81_26300 [Leptolyngbya sp. 'hensonii']